MTTPNKDMVIEALQRRFADVDSVDWDLIEASCENIYQQGILQGKYEALMESLKALKWEVKS